MKNLIKLTLTMLILLGLFFVGDIVNAKETVDINFSSVKYKWSHEKDWAYVDGLTSFNTLYRENIEENIKGYFFPVLIHSNSSTDYYRWTNEYLFTSQNSVQENCENGTSCNITGTLYARNVNFSSPSENYLKDVEVYYSTNGNHLIINSFDYPCNLTYQSDNTINFSCSVPVEQSNYNYVRVRLNNRLYEDLSSSDEYVENSFLLGLRSQVNYECNPLMTPNFRLEEVENSSLKATIINTSNYSSNTLFQYTLFNENDDFIYSYVGPRTDYTFSNLSNGIYKVSVEAVKDSDRSLYYEKVFQITDSVLPIARSNITDTDKTITVDLSESYSPKGYDIVRYYFSLDDENWFESESATYSFIDQEYRQYNVYYKVKDSSGVMSMTYKKVFDHKSPEQKREEQTSNFFDNVVNFFGNFFNNLENFFKDFWDYWWSEIYLKLINLKDAFISIFIPSEEFMHNWFMNLMQEFEEQLGFLSYPTTWLITFLDRYMSLTDTGHYVISWGTVQVPNFNQAIIHAGSFDLADLLSNSTLKNFHDLYLTIVNAMILLGFFGLCTKTYNDIFGISTTQVDYFGVSESTTATEGNTTVSESKGSKITKRRRKI